MTLRAPSSHIRTHAAWLSILCVLPSFAIGQVTSASVPPAGTGLKVLIEDSHGQSRVLDKGNFGQSGAVALVQKLGHHTTSGTALRMQVRGPFKLEQLSKHDIVLSSSRYNGTTTTFTQEECKMFVDYVSRGGWLVVAAGGSRLSDGTDAQFYAPMLAPFGVSFGSESIPNAKRIELNSFSHNELAKNGVSSIYAGVATSLTFSQSCRPTILGSVNKLPAIAVVSHGRGKLIAVGGGLTLANSSLAPAVPEGVKAPLPLKDNVQFFTNLMNWRKTYPPLSR